MEKPPAFPQPANIVSHSSADMAVYTHSHSACCCEHPSCPILIERKRENKKRSGSVTLGLNRRRRSRSAMKKCSKPGLCTPQIGGARPHGNHKGYSRKSRHRRFPVLFSTPISALFRACGLVMGAGALTGKHRNTPLTRYRLPPGKTTGALQPNANHALGRKAPEVFSAREEGADRFRPGTPWGMPRRLCSAIKTPPPSHRKLSPL